MAISLKHSGALDSYRAPWELELGFIALLSTMGCCQEMLQGDGGVIFASRLSQKYARVTGTEAPKYFQLEENASPPFDPDVLASHKPPRESRRLMPKCSKVLESCLPFSLCCDPCATCHCRFFNAICYCRKLNRNCRKKI
ncbi:AGRP protein, partial [Polypterus senegalus]